MSTRVTNKGIAWLHNEVCALLDTWADQEIQQQLSGRLHNMCVYERISQKLEDLGIVRSGEQCREKIKKLRRDYKTIIDNNYSAAFARRILVCFDKVHETFGKRTIQKPAHVVESIVYNENFADIQHGKNTRIDSETKAQSSNIRINDSSDGKFTQKLIDSSSISKKKQHNKEKHMCKLQKKFAKELVQKQSLSLEMMQSRHTILHTRLLTLEKQRFSNELSRQREKLLAIEAQRRQEREQKIELFKRILNAKLCAKSQM